MPYASRLTLLSRGEAAFHGPLLQAVGGRWLIMCKVRVADVIECAQPQAGGRGEPDWARFAAISQKHLDFVLCDPRSTRIRCAIELDDRSHESPHRRRRDAFLDAALRAAGVPLVRFRARSEYDPRRIHATLWGALHRLRPRRVPSTEGAVRAGLRCGAQAC